MDILDQDEFAVVEEQIAPKTPEPQEDLPEKYRGKSAAEIARMHQEAEKLISRQGQEVSEVRRLADQLLQTNLQAARPKPVPEPVIDDVDFFADPKSAVAKAVEQHPAVRNAQETAVRLARQDALRTLKETHPDYREIVREDEFKEWIGKSKIRSQLFQQADRSYDFDAANELISTFKELKAKKGEETRQEVADLRDNQERSLKAASNPAIGGSSEPTGKKIYRRADLIKLRMTNPDRYEMLESEIMAAYAEGRVR